VGTDFPLEVLVDVFLQRHVLVVPQVGIRLRVAILVLANVGRLVALGQRGQDRLLDRGRDLHLDRLQCGFQVCDELVAVLVQPAGDRHRLVRPAFAAPFPADSQRVAFSETHQRLDDLFLLLAPSFDFLLGRRAAFLLLRRSKALESPLLVQPPDPFRCHLEVQPQRALNSDLAEPEILVVEDLGMLAVREIAVQPRDFCNLVVANFVPLVVQALPHLAVQVHGIDQLDLAPPLGRLAIGDDPDVGEDARVVEQLIRHGDDGVQPIVLDNPAADFAFPAARVPREQRRTVEHDGQPRATVRSAAVRSAGFSRSARTA